MPRDIVLQVPVAVQTVQPPLRHLEPALDRFVGVGDAPRIRAPDHAKEHLRDLDPHLLADQIVPDDVDRGMWGDEGDAVDLLGAEFALLDLDDVLLARLLARHIGGDGEALVGRPGDPEDLEDIEGLACGDVVDHRPVPDRTDL